MIAEIDASQSQLNPNRELISRHMPGLDYLRGVAVAAVVLYHGFYWSAPGNLHNALANLFVHATIFGWLGVNLFFVLSGFLITGILMDTKHKPEYFKSFYTRRVLRILPAYLLMNAVLYVFHVSTAVNIAVALLYLANMNGLLAVNAGYGPLWSLSVEEQFYVFWPWIVRKLSTRGLMIFSFAICFIEPLLRLMSYYRKPLLGDVHEATWLIADNLAMGALLAIFARSRRGNRRNAGKLAWLLAIIAFVTFGALLPWGILHRDTPVGAALQTVPWNLFFTAVLLWALLYGNNLATIRAIGPFRTLGDISYGLYLIHLFIFAQYDLLLQRMGLPSSKGNFYLLLLRFFIAGGISVAIAWVSRRTYEQWFLNLKKYFPASAPKPPAKVLKAET